MPGTIKFEIFKAIDKAIKELCFAENPIKIPLTVPKIGTIMSS